METRDVEEPRAGSTVAPPWQGGGGEVASQLRQDGLAGCWACGWGPPVRTGQDARAPPAGPPLRP